MNNLQFVTHNTKDNEIEDSAQRFIDYIFMELRPFFTESLCCISGHTLFTNVP